MPCSPEILCPVLNQIEFIKLATACVSHSGNWFQVFSVCSGCKFFSARAPIIWNMTENNLNNMQAVSFLLYFESFGKINSLYFRSIKFEEKTWSGVSLILPCCNLPGLWCHESRSGVEAQTQLWTAVKLLKSILPFHAISDPFCLGKGMEEKADGWTEFWKQKSLKVYSGIGSYKCLNASNCTSNHSNDCWNLSAATSLAFQGSGTSKGSIRSSLRAPCYPRTLSLVSLGRTRRCKQKDITFLAVKMVSWWAPKQGECFVLPPIKGCLHRLISVWTDWYRSLFREL